LTVKTYTNLESITNAPTWKTKIPITSVLEDLGGNDKDLLKGFRHPEIGELITGSDKITQYRTPRLSISMKSSPNGISFFSFPWDRAALLRAGHESKILAFANLYYNGKVTDWIEEKLDSSEELVDSNRELHTGKVNLIHEAGKLKPRVFAMLDSFSQSILSDFHDDLMDVLKNIPEDCTFDQNKVSRVAIRKHWSETVAFYGFADLSSATDRLPKYLYEDIGNYIRSGLGSA